MLLTRYMLCFVVQVNYFSPKKSVPHILQYTCEAYWMRAAFLHCGFSHLNTGRHICERCISKVPQCAGQLHPQRRLRAAACLTILRGTNHPRELDPGCQLATGWWNEANAEDRACGANYPWGMQLRLLLSSCRTFLPLENHCYKGFFEWAFSKSPKQCALCCWMVGIFSFMPSAFELDFAHCDFVALPSCLPCFPWKMSDCFCLGGRNRVSR